MHTTDPHPPDTMFWADALATEHSLDQAVAHCAEQLGTPPRGGFDLLFVFVSPGYPELERLPELLAREIPHRHLIGCTGGGIIGHGREIEFNTAMALSAAHLPGVDITPFMLTRDDLADVGRGPADWHRLIGANRDDNPGFVVLADPFSLPADLLLEGLDYAYTGARVVGGLASGGEQDGDHRLFIDNATLLGGGVGVALSGNIHIDTVVAQGVKPVGPAYMVSKADGQYLYELENRPVFEVMTEFFETLPESERELAQRALFIGLAQRAADDDPGHGDFLIRNVLGADEQKQALVVGDHLREGQLVRMHVRDGAASAEDLETLLDDYLDRRPGPIKGALLFSCMGRGRGLYGVPDHDTLRFLEMAGPTPMAGFFCNGEIGPVGDTTYLHGYTSAFALFGTPQGNEPDRTDGRNPPD